MVSDKINNEYFEWIYELVCDVKHTNLSYRKLLCFLHNTEFTYILDNDQNRAIDGINFRYRFGYERGYSKRIIKKYLDTRPCSVLEMIVAMAYKVEEQIMDDYNYGDRTGQWFWNMIANLGLGQMDDNKFDRSYVEDVLFRFLNREYEANGEGGLFILKSPKYPMYSVEIWCQMMWYLDANFEFTV